MTTIRPYHPHDAEHLSLLIRQTLILCNWADYSLARLEPLIAYFSPAKINQLNQQRTCLVAQHHPYLIGTIALADDQICTFLVHPDFQGQGVGTRLLQAIEAQAQEQGLTQLTTAASLTSQPFYQRRGYHPTGQTHHGQAGPQIELRKQLTRQPQ